MSWIRNITRGKTLIRGLDHVAVVASDMDRSIEFYTALLGMKLIKDGRAEGGLKKSFIGTDKKAILAITEEKGGAGPGGGSAGGVNHVAFYVDDIERAGGLLREKGVRFIEEKVGQDGRTKAYHFLDPDGLELEICVETGKEAPQY
jgi:catechol 2,3-dioxygenase-like lactoylglutathione lyase family enzyme